MMTKTFVLLYFVNRLCVMESASILGVFPIPSISHQVVFRVLTQELVRRGHEVVVITTDPSFPKGRAPTNLTEIDVHNVSYNFLREKRLQISSVYGKESSWIIVENYVREVFPVLEVQIKTEAVQKLIQEKRKFDILLAEACVRPVIAFSHIFEAPVILVSSFGANIENLEAFGAPTHPILYPIPLRNRVYDLSLWEKIKEFYNYALYTYSQKYHNDRFDDELLQRIFGFNIPSVTELIKNVHMLFLNIHPIWMDNQPMPPSVVFMGGLHQKPKKKLPQDLKSYLDLSKNGVIYVSFGTNVHPAWFPADRLKVIIEAFSELSYDIIFKWSDDVESDELLSRVKNIKTFKWLPQSDLLRHPKVKAFVTQGGLQSTDEAITAGVPLVCIPMLGDQWYNAEKYVRLNIGVKLDLHSLTKSNLKNGIETVISNNSYRENIIKLRERMSDQLQPPLERAIWWIEYVLRHGGAQNLHAPAANMSCAEYYELKLIAIVLIFVLIIIILIVFLVISLLRYFLSHCVKVKKS